MMKVGCLILAGGLGLRLRNAVPDRPKCLAPIGSRSFLEIQLETLASQGITDFTLVLGHQSQQVQAEADRLASRFRIDCVVEPHPLGTGGAIAFAMDALSLAETLVVNGDTFVGGSLDSMVAPLDLGRGELIRMAVTEVENRARYGGIELIGDRVVGFFEKGYTGSGIINAGIYRISSHVFSKSEIGSAFSLESDTLKKICRSGNLFAYPVDGEFVDIGIPVDYFRFCSEHA